MNKFFNFTSLCLSAFLLTISTSCQVDSHNGTDKLIAKNENSQGRFYGKVIETIDTGNYTYIHVDNGKEKHWAAAPPVTLEKGRMVSFVPSMPMTNFTSKTLGRTFDIVYFVGQIYTDQAVGHPTKAEVKNTAGNTPTKPDDSIKVDNIKKAANGITISEALTQKQKLAGQTVRIRGIVVKYTAKVMKKNWIHIRDSSSSKDLAVTTSDTAKKGDVIVVSGKLQLDRDFGYGYVYDVLLEDSAITIE